MATGTKSFFSSSTISGLANVDARSSTPLFHVQPSGWPSIAQIKIGLCCSAAMRCASSTDNFQGIVNHGSPGDGRNCWCSSSKRASVKTSADAMRGIAATRMVSNERMMVRTNRAMTETALWSSVDREKQLPPSLTDTSSLRGPESLQRSLGPGFRRHTFIRAAPLPQPEQPHHIGEYCSTSRKIKCKKCEGGVS